MIKREFPLVLLSNNMGRERKDKEHMYVMEDLSTPPEIIRLLDCTAHRLIQSPRISKHSSTL